MKSIVDKLYSRVAKVGHVCVGLDTDPAYLPAGLAGRFRKKTDAIFTFNKELIDATIDAAACFKVQIAYYEALGLEGLGAYMKTLGYLRDNGAIVIADVKRGDIAKTAEMYAKAHFSGDFEADFITVNPFMGMDTLAPFFPYLETGAKGLFALVATSNPGAADIEGIVAADGESVSEKTGALIQTAGKPFKGKCGYSAIGAVVGCTNRDQTTAIRKRLDSTFFLIPGYGAQGGTAADMVHYFDKKKNGGVVNASRSILMAWKNPDHSSLEFTDAARAEVLLMRDQILNAL